MSIFKIVSMPSLLYRQLMQLFLSMCSLNVTVMIQGCLNIRFNYKQNMLKYTNNLLKTANQNVRKQIQIEGHPRLVCHSWHLWTSSNATNASSSCWIRLLLSSVKPVLSKPVIQVHVILCYFKISNMFLFLWDFIDELCCFPEKKNNSSITLASAR